MKHIYPLLIIIVLLFTITGCSSDSDNQHSPILETSFYKGMDLSFQMEYEPYNIPFKDENGQPINLLNYVQSQGNNLVRLRLWHTPENGQNTLDKVKLYAQKIKANNMDFLLDIHYSDFWADPAHQTPPAEWQNLSQIELEQAIYNYTRHVVSELENQGTTPKIIQIGNETDSGFLWNYGKVWGEFQDNWPNYINLVQAAIDGVKSIDTQDHIKIMIHYSNPVTANGYFQKLASNNLEYDYMALSYYPRHHTRDPQLLNQKLNYLSDTFNKPIMLVEVAYPFTFDWNDNKNNKVGSDSQIIPEYPATPEGQKAFMQMLINMMKNLNNDNGLGVCYWAPDFVAFDGNENTSTGGSSWENQCMFNFNYEALPIFEAYSEID
ncbi:MAG: hypothetical protein BM564_10570 [Bacteroidetes bacterium MedPE-SWsnd-G2]|nr:MAG: hypothetical protein BM564_10570 [Bacteroidetes bacterium MedPE-SWsnd-G2]